METDASSVLAAWVATPNNSLEVFKLSNTQGKLLTIINGMMRGCPQLIELDISKNKLSDKAVSALIRYIQVNFYLKLTFCSFCELIIETCILMSVFLFDYYSGIIFIAKIKHFRSESHTRTFWRVVERDSRKRLFETTFNRCIFQ